MDTSNAGKLIRVRERPCNTPGRVEAEIYIGGRLLYDAGIKPGDSVAVEVVADGELRVRRV